MDGNNLVSSLNLIKSSHAHSKYILSPSNNKSFLMRYQFEKNYVTSISCVKLNLSNIFWVIDFIRGQEKTLDFQGTNDIGTQVFIICRK